MVLLVAKSSARATSPACSDKFPAPLLECDGVVIVRRMIPQQDVEIRVVDDTIASTAANRNATVVTIPVGPVTAVHQYFPDKPGILIPVVVGGSCTTTDLQFVVTWELDCHL